MRLLECNSDGEFSLTKYFLNDDDIPSYAILSHTWVEGEEIDFQELKNDTGKSKSGYNKIRFCGELAKRDGLKYFWIDTCCIDKSNSVELQEAINSMFRWYQNAAKCYVYLSDVSLPALDDDDKISQLPWESSFKRSRWFTRGWTLQELLAPASVEFFSKEGERLGNKRSLEQHIYKITGIPVKALQGSHMSNFSITERMLWAEKRETTRKEDKAYSLLGICGVYMPLIYGEGRENAFKRLREEIDKVSNGINHGTIHTSPRIEDRQAEDKTTACRKTLLLTDPYLDRQNLISIKGPRVPGTCQWITGNSRYRSWLRGETQLLWISGGPGRGKTMLSIFLTEELKRQHAELLFYFCSYQDEKRNTAIAILRGLTYQIITKRRKLAKHVLPYLDTPERAQQALSSLETLWVIFRALVEDPNLGSVFCVLDGLDECDEDTIKRLVPKIVEIFSSENARPESFKLVIVSRDILGLYGCAQIKLDSDNDNRVPSDIGLFISNKVEQLSQIEGFTRESRSAIRKTLLERAEGTFLWVNFVINELSQKRTRIEAEEMLRTIPKGLPAIYSRMLLQIESSRRRTTSTILRWVATVVCPLTLKELAAITNIKSSASITAEQAVRDHVALCGLLCMVQEQEVHLIHPSARDYLLRREPDRDAVLEEFRIKPEEAHLEVAQTCLDCLTRSRLQDAPIHLHDGFSSQGSPFLKYAVLHWVEHARRCSTLAETLISRSISFLQKNSTLRKNWLELYPVESWRKPDTRLPLHIACFLGIEPWARALLRKKAWVVRFSNPVDERDNKGNTALFWAAMNGHEAVMRLLVERGANVDARAWWGMTALHEVAMNGHDAMVRLLVQRGADVNAKDWEGMTALQWAAMNGHEAVVQLLKSAGAS